MNKHRILVCGGRSFDDYALLRSILEEILEEKTLSPEDVEIVSGHCAGADTLGERWAEENGCALKIFLADWETYKRKAGPIRNKQMVEYIRDAENKYVVAFVSPDSRGTKQTVALARREGIPVRQTNYESKK